MTQSDFNKIIKQLNEYSYDVMMSKGPEYRSDNEDILNNFKVTANNLNISELKVWAAFMDKHLQSIFSHVKNANLKKSESIHSRFADIINYCYLGYALFVERDGKKKIN